MPLTEEHKQKMAEGRRKAAEAKKLKKAAAQVVLNMAADLVKPVETSPANGETHHPQPPALAVPAPAAAPLAAAGGKGLVPTRDELVAMDVIYDTMAAAGAIPRNNPWEDSRPLTKQEALAFMLKGWELGTPPIQSMEGLYISKDGIIAQKADFMRAMIQRSGIGVIVPLELTTTHVVVEGTRYGTHGRPDKVLPLKVTTADLQLSGQLTESAKKNLRGTLFARATGEMARALFSDLLKGACYTPEELASVTVVKDAPAQTKPPETAPEPVAASTPALPLVPRQETPQAASPAQPEASSPPPDPEQRPMTVAFQLPGQGGQLQQIQTAGITKPIMEAILSLARQSPELTERAKAELARHGVMKIRFLTGPEGESVLAALQGTLTPPLQAKLEEPIPAAGSAEQALRDFTEGFNKEHPEAPVDPDLVLRFVASSFDVEHVGHLDMGKAQQAVKEIRHLARDPQALGLLLGRATG